jgi:antitoxin (DNA-binding transcriptional repressor) of toxin-antitoxin stability system
MKLSISEARKRLPELVRQVRKDAGARVEIMVRDEVVAELRAALPEPEPGAAAKKLVELMRRLAKHRGKKHTYPGTLRNTSTAPAQSAVNGTPSPSVL